MAAGVFISHRGRDKDWVSANIEMPLRNRGLAVSVFYGFDPNRSPAANIRDGIESSEYFLPVVTNAWYESDWCIQHEFEYAKSLKKTIRGVLREKISDERLARIDLSTIDLTDPRTFVAMREQLFHDLGVPTTSERDVPSLTETLKQLGPPLPLPAVTLQRAEFPKVPFDAGVLWGVPRVAFAGLLSAPRHVRVLDTMVRAEGAILDAQYAATAMRLPDRWWIEFEIKSLPNGPVTLRDLFGSDKCDAESIAAQHTLAEWLKVRGLHPAMRLGCVLTIDDSDQDLRRAVLWCLRLAALVPDVAIVVHVTSETLFSSTRAVRVLETALHHERFPLDIELLEWRGSYPALREARRSPRTVLESELSTQVAAWLDAAWPRGTAAEFEERFPRLLAAGAEPEANRNPLPSATVSAFDGQGVEAEIWREMLLLVGQYVPERMEELLRAAAGSGRTPTHREAIRAALASDAWMDAYVSGVDWGVPEAFDPLRFVGADRTVDDVLLALFRRLARAGDSEPALTQAIERLSEWSWGEVGRLCRAVLGASTVAAPPVDADPADWLARARSGWPMPTADATPVGTSGDVGWCWWLGATVPKAEALTLLFDSSLERRAAFGAVTTEERDAVAEDDTLTQRVAERRRLHPESAPAAPRSSENHAG